MKKCRDLKFLPSKVILSDGSIVLLDELQEKEKLEIQICKKISDCVSRYYSSREDEWGNFILIMK